MYYYILISYIFWPVHGLQFRKVITVTTATDPPFIEWNSVTLQGAGLAPFDSIQLRNVYGRSWGL